MPRPLTALDGSGGHPLCAPVEEAGLSPGGLPATRGMEGRGKYSEYLALRSEVRNLEEALEARLKASHRHFFWAVLCLSPAAFLPMLGILRAGSLVLAAVLGALVSVVEFIRGMRARRDYYAILEKHERGKRRARELFPY
jgi:hypothetical protein